MSELSKHKSHIPSTKSGSKPLSLSNLQVGAKSRTAKSMNKGAIQGVLAAAAPKPAPATNTSYNNIKELEEEDYVQIFTTPGKEKGNTEFIGLPKNWSTVYAHDAFIPIVDPGEAVLATAYASNSEKQVGHEMSNEFGGQIKFPKYNIQELLTSYANKLMQEHNITVSELFVQ